ncbi:MAG: type II and III secretion system protein family protein, partial [Planctomycetota bacterium]
VGGVQQVLLHAKVMEVSRTKLRKLGVDWAYFNSNDFVVSSVSGLITAATGSSVTTSGQETFVFGVVDGSSAFFGVLDALRQDDLAKVLAEPTLVTVSGRPAQFNSGGEFPVPVPQSLGTISIEFKKYGTQLDFVPIVLGNGLIRLEVRPRVSELDKSRSLTIAGTTVPGLRMREVETGVELRAGQTLAIAGLVYYRSEGQTRGLPLISDVPYLGIPFRKVSEEANELELLIMVTPELVEPMNLSQVPPCGPGMQTTNGNDCELYFKGFLEVPVCCPTCEGSGCEACQGGGLPSEGMIGPVSEFDSTQNSVRSSGGSGFATAQPGSPQGRQIPVASQNRARPTAGVGNGGEPSFIGPIGYDVVN